VLGVLIAVTTFLLVQVWHDELNWRVPLRDAKSGETSLTPTTIAPEPVDGNSPFTDRRCRFFEGRPTPP